jgi:hypothetical protein
MQDRSSADDVWWAFYTRTNWSSSENISNMNYDLFSVIWTGLRKSLNIAYDYAKHIILVTKMGQITIKLVINTAVCNIGA